MVDEQTLVVSYRDWRGEPRGKHRKGETWDGRGDCVDCHACVAVCPTGVDIRDGLQLECIGCGLCIDACDEIMTRVGRPLGLLGFDTEANRAAHERGAVAHPRFIRPRTAIYIVVMLAAAGAMLATLLMRNTASLTVLPERSPLFVRLSDGSISNSYTIKIVNKSGIARTFQLSAGELPQATLQIAEGDAPPIAAEEGVPLAVKPDSVGTFHAYVHVKRTSQAETPFAFVGRAKEDGEVVTYHSTFRGPAK